MYFNFCLVYIFRKHEYIIHMYVCMYVNISTSILEIFIAYLLTFPPSTHLETNNIRAR